MAKYFFFGMVFNPNGGSKDDKPRVTAGPNFMVEGGSEKEHKDSAEIIRLLEEGVRMDGIHHAQEIFRDAVKKVKGDER